MVPAADCKVLQRTRRAPKGFAAALAVGVASPALEAEAFRGGVPLGGGAFPLALARGGHLGTALGADRSVLELREGKIWGSLSQLEQLRSPDFHFEKCQVLSAAFCKQAARR